MAPALNLTLLFLTLLTRCSITTSRIDARNRVLRVGHNFKSWMAKKKPQNNHRLVTTQQTRCKSTTENDLCNPISFAEKTMNFLHECEFADSVQATVSSFFMRRKISLVMQLRGLVKYRLETNELRNEYFVVFKNCQVSLMI